jgi:hypothetical protein
MPGDKLADQRREREQHYEPIGQPRLVHRALSKATGPVRTAA